MEIRHNIYRIIETKKFKQSSITKDRELRIVLNATLGEISEKKNIIIIHYLVCHIYRSE